MPENNHADKKDNSTSHAGLRWILIAGCILFLALLFLSIFLPNLTERVKFFTVNALSLLVLAVIAVQAYIYRRQWEAMQGQLKVMQDQTTALQDGLTETRKMVAQNERVVSAMEIQAKAAQDAAQAAEWHVEFAQQNALHASLDTAQSLNETRKMVELNARAVEAAERNAKVAEQAFYSSERPHFGITNIWILFEVGTHFAVGITFMNGGKTPAWYFDARVWISFGRMSNEDVGIWSIEPQVGDMHNSFVPAGVEKAITYDKTDFVVTQEMVDSVISGKIRLFIKSTASWIDARNEPQGRHFMAVYHPSTQRFGDYLSTQ